MIRKALVAAVMTPSCFGGARGEEPAAPDAAPVAKVLGKPITRADLEARVQRPPGEAAAEPNWGEALLDVIMPALVQRYLDENELRARESEIEAIVTKMFTDMDATMREMSELGAVELRAKIEAPDTPEAEREALRIQLRQVERAAKGERWPDADGRAQLEAEAARCRRELESPDLSASNREQIERSLAYAERFRGLTDEESRVEYAKAEQEMRREMAAPIIEWWKFNRSLYKKYGGRILFQQGGLEAFDATKTWLEEREKAGDFEILDTRLRPGFWEYYTRDQSAFLIEEPEGTEFDIPWWELEELKE